jgi:transposase
MKKFTPAISVANNFEPIRELLENARKKTRPRTVDLPEVFCVILYLLKSGCQWRMLSERLSEMAQGLPLFLVMERET